MIIEDMTLLDAIFMTTITITTVGYGVIKELSSAGTVFTIILILLTFLFRGDYIYDSIKLALHKGCQLHPVPKVGRHLKSPTHSFPSTKTSMNL